MDDSVRDHEVIGTQQKAFAINLDGSKYGAFAEIGAGQEVARWFFQVGGAAGTVAKSMSAYDMIVSDTIYGPSKRYVSQQRLSAMLDHEYDLLIERLDGPRGADTTFFAFADTVTARSYRGNNECHGWMGIRFQTDPRSTPSQVQIHVRMLDRENVAQQEALGIVGVNLIHAAFFLHGDPNRFLRALLDNLTTGRIEVDMVHFSGPSFERVDHRLVSLHLVQLGLSGAAMFAPDGTILQPSEVLYKKPVLVERGRFRPVTNLHMDMLESARRQFALDPGIDENDVVVLMELTMHNLEQAGEVDYRDFLARADMLAATGATVMVSNFFEYFRLAEFLAVHTNKPIGLALGIPNLRSLFDESYYEKLSGGILEALGRLFQNSTKLYVYPVKDDETGRLITLRKMEVAPSLRNLFHHLVDNGCIEGIDYYDVRHLDIYQRNLAERIEQNDDGWETLVPASVAETIRAKGYFNMQPPAAVREAEQT